VLDVFESLHGPINVPKSTPRVRFPLAGPEGSRLPPGVIGSAPPMQGSCIRKSNKYPTDEGKNGIKRDQMGLRGNRF
jgi:hypothetical protein